MSEPPPPDGGEARGSRERPKAQSPERAALLGRVRQARTAPEEVVAKILRAAGLAYRRNVRDLPGRPDFAHKGGRWAIFVNGCFWHHHRGCARGSTPKNNRAFWTAKFAANRRRDADRIRALRRMGFRVLVVWECEAASFAERLAGLARPLGRGARRRSTTAAGVETENDATPARA